VKELMAGGANTKIRDNNGLSAREWALRNRHQEVAALLTGR